MFNESQVTISGWIGGPVSLKEVAGGRHVVTFRMASTPSRWRDGGWVSGPTSWHTVKAWNQLARHAAASLSSGDPVLVHGVLTAESWTRADNVQMTSYAVVARSIGHDLSQCTTSMSRTRPESEATPDAA